MNIRFSRHTRSRMKLYGIEQTDVELTISHPEQSLPGLQKVPKHKHGPFPAFEELLTKMKYHITYGVVAAQDYGAPQLRRRFVLLASKHGEINIPLPTYGKNQDNPYKTVRDAIEDLPALAAGETYREDDVLNHQWR